MTVREANSWIPLIAAGGYTLLLIVSFIRPSPRRRMTKWLLAFLALSIAWESLILYAPDLIRQPNLSGKVLLVGAVLLGALTAVYAEWPRLGRWLALGSGALLLSLIIGVILPAKWYLLRPSGLPRISYGSLITHLLWLILGSYLLVRTWVSYRHTRLPWHANRLLFWLLTLFTIFAAEILLQLRWTGLTAAGQALRFLGAASAVYAVSSHRILDVRTGSRNILVFTTINLVSGLPIALAVLLVQWGAADEPTSTVILLTIIATTAGLVLFQPLRRIVERMVYRYFLGEGVNASKVVRDYSQAVYRTLDVDQLSLAIMGTLGALLEADRGALMLVTDSDLDLEIEPIPAIGQVSRRTVHVPKDSPFAQTLIAQHQPLLQYDIDFNPEFADVSPEERSWLNELAMEVYVPVSTGNELVGLIGIGPRSSGTPYQPRELELSQILADQTVVALQNSRLYRELTAQNEKIRDLNVDLLSQNERLAIMDRVKSDFITIASHELRTPLTQVKGYADILAAMNEEESLTQDQTRRIVSHINRASNLLEEVITAMLDASQIDVAGMRLAPVQTSLEEIVQDAVEPLLQAIRERQIALTYDGLKELPLIYGDVKRLTQAFTNLVGNAVKYTPDNGRITIHGSFLPSYDGDNEYVEVIIADSGIGIDPTYHELIFEKFFRVGDPQLHSTGSTKYKGAGPGLGLPIAKGVIEAHGGHIWVESEGEDEKRFPGSRFCIVLPVRPSGSPPPLEHGVNSRNGETSV